MKKGLLALMVVALLLVGMVSYSAAPEMWGIPDVVIGDAEDMGFTDNFFVFTDAFVFDEYFHWVSDGAKNLAWRYLDCDTPGQIEINRLEADPNGIGNVAGGFATASFRNIALSPHGGPYSLNPVGWPSGTTDSAIVSLMVDNFLVVDSQDIAVFTEDGGNDGLTNTYNKVDQFNLVMTADPGWGWAAFTVGVAPGSPYGITPALNAYNATSDALTITSTGTDNNFGYYYKADIPWYAGQAYLVVCELFGTPAIDEANIPFWRQYIPGLRIRMNAKNETIASSLTVLSEAMGTVGLTSEDQTASTDAFIFDPRDHSNMAVDLQSLYFSFDMMEFAAQNRDYIGQRDDEGTLGLKSIDISTFPVKMLWREATEVKSWPTGATFAETFATDFSTVENGYGGNPPTISSNLMGDIVLTSLNVGAGFAIAQLNQGSGYRMNDAADYYALKFYLKSNNLSANWVRMRVMDDQGQRNADLNLFDFYGGYQLPGFGGAVYNVFLTTKRPQYDSMYLIYAIDLIDFNESGGNTEVSCSAVSAYGASLPVVAP